MRDRYGRATRLCPCFGLVPSDINKPRRRPGTMRNSPSAVHHPRHTVRTSVTLPFRPSSLSPQPTARSSSYISLPCHGISPHQGLLYPASMCLLISGRLLCVGLLARVLSVSDYQLVSAPGKCLAFSYQVFLYPSIEDERWRS